MQHYRISGQNLSMDALNPTANMVHALASKALHTHSSTTMKWSSPGIQPAKVFYLACKTLKGNVSLSFLTVAQTITNLPITKDSEEAARRRARLATEAIASFDAHASDGQELTTSYDLPASAGATYLSDVAARPARERRVIRHGVVRMVNDFDILVVTQARGNTTRVSP